MRHVAPYPSLSPFDLKAKKSFFIIKSRRPPFCRSHGELAPFEWVNEARRIHRKAMLNNFSQHFQAAGSTRNHFAKRTTSVGAQNTLTALNSPNTNFFFGGIDAVAYRLPLFSQTIHFKHCTKLTLCIF